MTLRRRPRLLSLLGSAVSSALLVAVGCGRPGMGEQVDLNGDPSMGEVAPLLADAILTTTAAGDALSWESAPWMLPDPADTRWIPYGPHTVLHISHPLGRTPSAVLVYISFVETGTSPALAAGDLARIVEATADDVTVWNDTNGNYFCRVVLE